METKAKKETTKKVVKATTKKTTTKKKVKVSAEGTMPARHCKMESCKREYRAKGYCATHYRMWRNGKFGRARFKTCKDYGCTKPMAMNRHGFCEEHFQNYYVKGLEQAHAPAEKPAAKAEEKAAS